MAKAASAPKYPDSCKRANGEPNKSAIIKWFAAQNPELVSKLTQKDLALSISEATGIEIAQGAVAQALRTDKPATKKRTVEEEKDFEKLAMRFAFLQAGGIEKAIKLVQEYEQDATAQYIADCGDAVTALDHLTRLKALTHK